MAERWTGEAIDSLHVVTGGATNRIFEVRAAGRTTFLRRYRRLGLDAVRREHTLIRHVNAHGLSAPEALGVNGDTALAGSDGAVWAMFRAATGVQLGLDEITPEIARSAGATLAVLHLATASADTALRRVTLSWDGPSWVQRLQRVRDEIRRRDRQSEVDRWALRRVEAQASWLAESRARHQYVPRHPGQIVHGDYQHANLFFADGHVADVIDWDTAVIAPRAYELARTAFFMCRMDAPSTIALLQGYRSINPLDDDELADGALAWGTFADHHVWPVEEVYLNDNRTAERFIWRRPFRPFADEWADIITG